MSDVACYVVENSACDLIRSRVRVDTSLDQMEPLYCWGFKKNKKNNNSIVNEHIYIQANHWTGTGGIMSY